MRRKLQCVFVWSMLMAVLSGCQNSVEGVAESKREELVMWSYFETDAQRAGLDALAEGFNQSQKNYILSWEYVPMTDFDKELSRSYTEQNLPDMVLIDNPDMPSFIRMGIFEDITDKILEWNLEEEYYQAVVETVMFKGRYYGIPFICNNLALIYNTEMLEKAQIDPPKSWEELEAVAATLTNEETYGFLMCAIQSEQGAFQILPWILGAGENEDSIGGKKTLETYQFLNRLVETGSMSANCINLSQTDVAWKFIEEEAAMIENGPWILPMLEAAGISYGITYLPAEHKGGMITGGENIGIVKGKNVNGSLEFLNYCKNSEIMEDFCLNTGGIPTRKVNANALVKKNPDMRVFVDQMEYAIPRTSITGWTSISSSLTYNFYKMILGEKTPERAVETISDD